MSQEAHLPFGSVIIPTYNRMDSLQNVLCSLAERTYPCDRFEVVVVDDGSPEDYTDVSDHTWPFALRYYQPSNPADGMDRHH